MTCLPCQQLVVFAQHLLDINNMEGRVRSWDCTCEKPWTYDDVPAPRRTTPLKVRIVERPDGSRIKAFAHDLTYVAALVDDRIWRFYE
jgi:hypothetical protein